MSRWTVTRPKYPLHGEGASRHLIHVLLHVGTYISENKLNEETIAEIQIFYASHLWRWRVFTFEK